MYGLRGRNAGERRGAGRQGIKGSKKWDNCNSIINKIYFKKEEKAKHYRYFNQYSITIDSTSRCLVSVGIHFQA